MIHERSGTVTTRITAHRHSPGHTQLHGERKHATTQAHLPHELAAEALVVEGREVGVLHLEAHQHLVPLFDQVLIVVVGGRRVRCAAKKAMRCYRRQGVSSSTRRLGGWVLLRLRGHTPKTSGADLIIDFGPSARS